MFDFREIYSCCTARMLEDIPNWSTLDKGDKLQYLNILKRREHPKAKDSYAIFIMILTHTQMGFNGELVEKLGFQHSFLGSKDQSSHRHPETGDLHVYCVKPVEFYAALDKYITELTPQKLQVSPEEIARRRTCPMLTMKLINSTFCTEFYTYSSVPDWTSLHGRNLAKRLKEITGGFDPAGRGYSFERLIVSARQWRNGDF